MLLIQKITTTIPLTVTIVCCIIISSSASNTTYLCGYVFLQMHVVQKMFIVLELDIIIGNIIEIIRILINKMEWEFIQNTIDIVRVITSYLIIYTPLCSENYLLESCYHHTNKLPTGTRCRLGSINSVPIWYASGIKQLLNHFWLV